MSPLSFPCLAQSSARIMPVLHSPTGIFTSRQRPCPSSAASALHLLDSKQFIASLNFTIFSLKIDGALMLSNMGFRPLGTNLSLIMLDENKKDKHLVETRFYELLEDLNVDKTKITEVTHNSTRWNVEMMVYTAFCCLLSMIPYIYLNLRGGSSLLHGIRRTFPTVRAVGGFLTATMMQLIIQRRITTLCRRCLSKHDHGQTGDPLSEGARRMSEIDESDNRRGGSGRASDHHDIEQGPEPTGASHKDEKRVSR